LITDNLSDRGDVRNERRPVSFQPGNPFLMEEHIEVEGRITSVLAGTMFRVELDNKHQVLATISGKMRKRFVRLTIGDRVKMEMSQYDLNKARIVWRLG
jgi:translation initiation factor IF-1